MKQLDVASQQCTANNLRHPEHRSGVLLLGNYRPTLSLARSLHRAGYRILLGTGGGEGCGEYSRSVSEAWHHPSLSRDPDRFFDALCEFLRLRTDIHYLFPVAEEFVIFLSARRSELPAHITCVLPDHETIEQCTDKVGLLSLAEHIGIKGPPFRSVKHAGELAGACKDIGLPAVVRPLPPNRRIAQKKAVCLENAQDVHELHRRLQAAPSDILIQRKAEGEREDIIFAACKGKVVRAIQVRYLRTDHVDGTGLCVYGEVVALSDQLMFATDTLVAALNYSGVGCTQFIVDRDTSRYCLVELNPRISAIHQIAESMQMELARLAIEIADGNNSTAPFNYLPGKRFAWTYGELRAIKSALREQEVDIRQAMRWTGAMVRSAVTADEHLTWNFKDPVPTLALFAKQLLPTGIFRRASAEPVVPSPAKDIRWEVHSDLSSAALPWTHLENTGVHTPFQRRTWLEAYLETIGKGDRPCIVVGHQNDRPVAVFPLCIVQCFGTKRLEWLGQDYSDYNAPLCDRRWLESLSQDDADSIWRSVRKAVGGVDVTFMAKQPLFIEDIPNVFVHGNEATEAANAHLLSLEESSEALFKKKFSRGTQRRLKEKSRRLSKEGNVQFERIADPTDKSRLTKIILSWKSAQLAGQGARNPFATRAAKDFLIAAAHKCDSIGVYTLCVNDEPLAGIITLEADGGPLIYQMAYAAGPLSRCSPGRVLLNQLIDFCIDRGDQHIDFTTGDEDYKLALCDVHSTLQRTIAGHTLVGKLIAVPLHSRLWLKRQIKSRKRSMNMLQSANRKWQALRLNVAGTVKDPAALPSR
ncbi:MAG: GNAT family N-acetyltransferase [Alphaproteobacteria bacterium]|nr:GNAT family N-acetyltransferase [Alphaproteobacteria bacterium]